METVQTLKEKIVESFDNLGKSMISLAKLNEKELISMFEEGGVCTQVFERKWCNRLELLAQHVTEDLDTSPIVVQIKTSDEEQVLSSTFPLDSLMSGELDQTLENHPDSVLVFRKASDLVQNNN